MSLQTGSPKTGILYRQPHVGHSLSPFTPFNLIREDIEDLKSLIVGRLVSSSLFELAATKAEQTGVSLDGLLLQEGLMEEEAYFQLLANTLGVDYLPPQEGHKLQFQPHDLEKINQRFQWASYRTDDGFAFVPLSTNCMGPKKLRLHMERVIQQFRLEMSIPPHTRFYLVSPRTVRSHFQSRFSSDLLHMATHNLADHSPDKCAKGGLVKWQWLVLLTLIGGVGYGLFNHPLMSIIGVSVGFSLFFFSLICFRLFTCLYFKKISAPYLQPPTPLPRNHRDLPVYTLLIPLFKETAVLEQLVAALEELDYPKTKLDIKLLLEEVDFETIEAVNALKLPPYFHVVIVPDGQPRTKPKALNYGLLLAEGEYCVIYDAEDIPEPDQLRRALQAFYCQSSECAVIQAKLNFYNPRQNWLTRQFTLEYSSLFDGLLPSIVQASLPLPLGGTSNHFKKSSLLAVGAWDPYNVTEDADLGMRFYRSQMQSDIIASTTYEEACSGFSSWFCQRTRWLKGWMQTYYVHMRQPFHLLRDLGVWKFFGFQLIMGAPIFSALVHPLFMGILIWAMAQETIVEVIPTWPLWGLALFNLVFGYLASMWLGALALTARNFKGFALTIVTLPFYWLLVSFAAYRALLQLLYAPYFWEKTEHKGKVPSIKRS